MKDKIIALLQPFKVACISHATLDAEIHEWLSIGKECRQEIGIEDTDQWVYTVVKGYISELKPSIKSLTTAEIESAVRRSTYRKSVFEVITSFKNTYPSFFIPETTEEKLLLVQSYISSILEHGLTFDEVRHALRTYLHETQSHFAPTPQDFAAFGVLHSQKNKKFRQFFNNLHSYYGATLWPLNYNKAVSLYADLKESHLESIDYDELYKGIISNYRYLDFPPKPFMIVAQSVIYKHKSLSLVDIKDVFQVAIDKHHAKHNHPLVVEARKRFGYKELMSSKLPEKAQFENLYSTVLFEFNQGKLKIPEVKNEKTEEEKNKKCMDTQEVLSFLEKLKLGNENRNSQM